MKRKRPSEFDLHTSDHDLLLWTASAVESLQRSVNNHLKHHVAFELAILTALLMTIGALVVSWLT